MDASDLRNLKIDHDGHAQYHREEPMGAWWVEYREHRYLVPVTQGPKATTGPVVERSISVGLGEHENDFTPDEARSLVSALQQALFALDEDERSYPVTGEGEDS